VEAMDVDLWKEDIELAAFAAIENQVKMISVDLFGTLLLRTVDRVSDLYSQIAISLLEHEVLNKDIDPIAFKELRISAEQRARESQLKSTGSREVSLREIYAQFPESIGNRDRMMRAEVSVDCSKVYRNDIIVSMLQYARSRGVLVVLLADTYYQTEEVRSLIDAAMIPQSLFGDIVLSNEHRSSKSNGKLFEVLCEKQSISPSEIVHVGSDYRLDVVQAGEAGLKTLQYTACNEIGTIFEIERYSDKELAAPSILPLRKTVRNMSASYMPEKRFWFEFGASVLGPFLTLYIEWVLLKASEKGITRFYPFMREAGIISKLLERSLSHKGTGDFLVKPLYISRKASYLPGIGQLTELTIEQLIEDDRITIGVLLDRFGLRMHPFMKYRDVKLSHSGNVPHSNGRTLKTSIREYLSDPAVLKYVNESIENNKRRIIAYLKQEYDLTHPYMTIDIGYSGSIPNAIDRIIADDSELMRGYHALAFSSAGTRQKLLDGIQIIGFTGNAGSNIEYMKSANWNAGLLEVLLLENIGSTVGYEYLKSGNIAPVLEEAEWEAFNYEPRRICHEGIITFQERFLKLIDTKPWLLPEILQGKNNLHRMITRFMEYPSNEEANYIGELLFENEFVDSQAFSTLLAFEQQLPILQSVGPDKYLIRKHANSNTWPAGVVEKAYPNYSLLRLFKESRSGSQANMIARLHGVLFDNGIKDVIIYGAGEIGQRLMQLCLSTGIRVVCIADSNRQLWGRIVSDARICSLDETLQQYDYPYVIASLSYMTEMKQYLIDQSSKFGKRIRIFDIEQI